MLIANESYKDAAEEIDEELFKIINDFKEKKISKNTAYTLLEQLKNRIYVLQKMEKIENLHSSDPEFGNEVIERLGYAELYKDIDKARMKISRMVFPDKLI
ncbi:MAG: hypothetical protein HC836_16720 [Richelia sp. RM2_1_2]|nr:hypothetical protein [Richelia sp. RM2_1_2]